MPDTLKVKTTFWESGKIAQMVYYEGDDGVRPIWESVTNTQEQQIRDALIAMGWTPPPQNSRQQP